MSIMTYAKFDFDQLILTLIFGIWASEPLPSQTTEMARPDGAHPISSKRPFSLFLITVELVQVSSLYFVPFPKI